MVINNATVYQVYISAMDLFTGSIGYLLVIEESVSFKLQPVSSKRLVMRYINQLLCTA